jgi:ribosome-binding factor A
MNSDRKTRVSLNLKELASAYINSESNRKTLITVTDVRMSSDLKRATILISAFPEAQSHAALDFLKRKRSELRAFIKERVNMKSIPHIEVELDEGEQHRQKIDRLLDESSRDA